MNERENISPYEVGAYILLFSLVAAVFHDYELISVRSNTVSQIPLVLRQLDDTYLSGDWYVNQMSVFTPRTIYVQVVALLAKVVGLPAAYLILRFVNFIAPAFITYYVTTSVFKGDRLAGLIAAILVVTVSPFVLGNTATVVNTGLGASVLAKPLSLLAVAFAMRRRPILCGLVAGITSLLQPLIGVLIGSMSLAALFVLALIDVRAWPRLRLQTRYGDLVKCLAGFAVLLPFAVFWTSLVPSAIPDDEFINIVAHVRSPHHRLPSTWPIHQYARAVILFLGFGVLFSIWRRQFARDSSGHGGYVPIFVLMFCSQTLALLIMGYFFVELIPVKTIVIIQAFRYIYLPLWFGLMILGCIAAFALQKFSPARRVVYAISLLSGSGRIQPLLVLLGSLGLRWRWQNFQAHLHAAEAAVGIIALLLIALQILVYSRSSILYGVLQAGGEAMFTAFKWLFAYRPGYGRGMPLLSLAGALIVLLVIGIHHKAYRLIGLASPLVAVLGLFALDRTVEIPVIGSTFERMVKFTPTFDSVARNARKRRRSRINGLIEAAAFAKNELPGGAIFLTPPNFGAFRMFAERAIVVDFKAWPMYAPGAWYHRLTDVYGVNKGAIGIALELNLEAKFGNISDQKISEIATQYDASHAVLFRTTRTRYPVLFTGNVYKIVDIQDVTD